MRQRLPNLLSPKLRVLLIEFSPNFLKEVGAFFGFECTDDRPHRWLTSASLVIYENADSSARVDLHGFFQRLCPEDDDSFTHRSEGPDDMPAHLRTILTRTSEVIPIFGGQVQMGTWQGVFLFEHRRAPQVRKAVITVIGMC